MAASHPDAAASRADQFGFFRRMNLAIVSIFAFCVTGFFLPAAWDSRAIEFQELNDGSFRASISRFGRTYEIDRLETSGSGEYIEFTISQVEPNGKTLIATYSTCGHYRDEGTKLLFFEPHGFHCGLFSSRWNDLFSARFSQVEFSESGATPSFLPSEPE